jgi:hypothetical protein
MFQNYVTVAGFSVQIRNCLCYLRISLISSTRVLVAPYFRQALFTRCSLASHMIAATNWKTGRVEMRQPGNIEPQLYSIRRGRVVQLVELLCCKRSMDV